MPSAGRTAAECSAAMGEAPDQLPPALGGRPGLPEEIAAAITYLVSNAAEFRARPCGPR